MRTFAPSAALLALLLALPAQGAEHVVSQMAKNFSVKRLAVQQGDTIKFVNDDPLRTTCSRCPT